MKYLVSRDGKEFGPYALEDLRAYVAQGNIAPTDWVRAEDSQQWVAASQVLGTAGSGPLPGSLPGGAQPRAFAGSAGAFPDPPEMHWAAVLGLGIITCGIFMIVWMFRQALYAKKLDPQDKTVLFYALYLVCTALNSGASFSNMRDPSPGVAFVGTGFALVGVVLLLVGAFGMRKTFETHFQTAEPVGLRLSAPMTFFFNTLYFQYHLSRIASWRRTGVLA